MTKSPHEVAFWKMEDQAYFGNEESFSSILHSQTLMNGPKPGVANSSRKSKREISLKNIGLILHFPELRLQIP